MNALQTIQQKLKAPKSAYNKFGQYNYRSQEDILEAVKPLLGETNSTLIIEDDIIPIGGQLFLKATATLWPEGEANCWSASAYALHGTQQSGMNPAQLTGATSSYARKYALNGLFLIDDTKDADATNDHDKSPKVTKEPVKKAKPEAKDPIPTKAPEPKAKKLLVRGTPNFEYALKRVGEGIKVSEIEKAFDLAESIKAELTAAYKPLQNETK